MTKLPAHVRGWKIAPTNNRPELTVIRAGSWLGPHYEVGGLNDAMTKIDPKAASAWLVESDTRPGGMAFMSLKAEGGNRWDAGYRATAAIMHFCVEAEGPNGSGYLHENGLLQVPGFIIRDTNTRDTASNLQSLGFSMLYSGGDFIANAARVHALTSSQFAEFAQAVELPHLEDGAAAVSAGPAEAE